MPGAADSSAAANQWWNFGSSASLDDLSPCSVVAWTYPNAITTSFTNIMGKRTSGTAVVELRTNESGSVDNFIFEIGHGTTNAVARSSNDITVGTWNFIAGTWTATQAPKLFHGSLSKVITEVTYTTQTSPVGARGSEASANFVVLARNTSSGTPYNGAVAMMGYYNEDLTVEKLRQIQFNPFANMTNCKLLVFPGHSGLSACPDWSGTGNNLVSTGISVTSRNTVGIYRPGLRGPTAGIMSMPAADPLFSAFSGFEFYRPGARAVAY